MYEYRPQIVDIKFLHRSSIHDRRNWSKAMQIAQKTCKYISMTDDSSLEPAWLSQNKKWGRRPHDCMSKILYHTILQLPTSHHDGYWSRIFRITVQNYTNTIKVGDRAIEQALTALGYQENIEWVLFLALYSSFQFLLLFCKRSHFYWSTVIQITPQTCENITITDNLAMKPLWLFMSNKKQ